MLNNEFNRKDVNECTSRGVCSVTPSLAALQELLLLFLKQISHYVILLNKMGGVNNQVRHNIIEDVASLAFINELSEAQLFDIVLRNYYLFKNVKNICQNKSETANDCWSEEPLTSDFSENIGVNAAISIGEKLINKGLKSIQSYKKKLYEIMFTVIKSVCTNLSMLGDYTELDNGSYIVVIKALECLNTPKMPDEIIKNMLHQLVKIDVRVRNKLCSLLTEKYGDISKTKVLRSAFTGKSILVSGNNLTTLKKILEVTRDKGINVYTHSNLVISHAFSEFKKYNHLAGHYGEGMHSAILDFATFPGVILLTRSSKNTSEFLYRGKIYSDDFIAHKGIKQIDRGNYRALVNAALEGKGFKKNKEYGYLSVGYDADEIEKFFLLIYKKLNNNEIKRLYIVGLNPYSEIQKEYYKEFFKNIKSNEYVISFSYESQKKNVYTINIGNYYVLATEILTKLFNMVNIKDCRIVFMFTTCDVYNISEILWLKELGAKNVYMASCSPNIFKPNVFSAFLKEYDIHLTTDAISDLYEIRHKKSALE